jgi:tetratricopeptide (TPR) repeat protein
VSSSAAGPSSATPTPRSDVRPYIIRTYDRWIILVLVLVGGWLLFRPMFGYAVYYRGLSFERMLMFHTAEHYYRKATNVDPRVPEGWIGLGQLYMMWSSADPGYYAAATQALQSGLAYNPRNARLAFDLCRVYYVVGHDYANALDACRTAIANDPDNPFAWDYAGWASHRLGKRELARYYWQETLKRLPGDNAVRAALKRFG